MRHIKLFDKRTNIVISLLFALCVVLVVWVAIVNSETRSLISKNSVLIARITKLEHQRAANAIPIRYDFCVKLETLRYIDRIDAYHERDDELAAIKAIKKYPPNKVITSKLLKDGLKNATERLNEAKKKISELKPLGPGTIHQNCTQFSRAPLQIVGK